MFVDEPAVDPRRCYLERRPDGAIVVRVPVAEPRPIVRCPMRCLPFRAGDPQFAFWQQQFSQVQHAGG